MQPIRECLAVNVLGTTLRGTGHSVAGVSVIAADGPCDSGKIGILMLNFGFAPRASLGDITVHQSDHIAALGYPVFRFDMPGLGDSDGDLPANALTIVQNLQRGEHTLATCALAAEVRSRFKLDALLLAGHCGGAVTALFAAERLKGRNLAGLLLYETDFIIRGESDWQNSRLAQFRQEVRVGILGSRLGHRVQTFYTQLKRAKHCLKAITFRHKAPNDTAGAENRNGVEYREKASLPDRANLPVIKSYRRVVQTGVPILMVAVPDLKATDGFDYAEFLLSDKPANVTYVPMHETNHSFVEGNGRHALNACTERWLLKHFPIPKPSPIPTASRT